MSNDLVQTRRKGDTIDNLNIDSAGGEVIFHFGGPIRPLRVGFTVTTAVDPDNTENLDIEIFRQVTAGSETNRVSLGVFRVMAGGAANLAAGTTVYKDLHVDDGDGETAEDGSLRFLAPATVYDATNKQSKQVNDILVGQALQLELQASAEADSGAGYAWVEYVELPFAKVLYGNTVNKDTSQDVSTTGPA